MLTFWLYMIISVPYDMNSVSPSHAFNSNTDISESIFALIENSRNLLAAIRIIKINVGNENVNVLSENGSNNARKGIVPAAIKNVSCEPFSFALLTAYLSFSEHIVYIATTAVIVSILVFSQLSQSLF